MLLPRFEKSLYDLIRGLRNHKGTEGEYIQASLRECRTEIKGQDMDVKATALLKLIYLEMYGHDMSWASFHILEVMSSVKYLQKRVGYLGAVQSFRSDTEVLMLATNLLKKDLTSPVSPTLSLPLVTLPHVINQSLAMSLMMDLVPRLTHSQASVRKKTVVALYRFALVYPETLRLAWPKIKERLMDEREDPTVTAAIVNVVCELGWRRPQDFLSMAPRLFDLLVEGGNNWMAIKIVKLFATLTPLEPRLVKKLLPPLTSLIRTTPAMSLLYECINGIIQGGILNSTEDTAEGEEIAKLCVGKLRGMIAIEGDPNLKYVALLAFQKIVRSHSYLVSLHQDVILGCVDDADISIRLRALDLLVNMVDSGNLATIVERLLRQLSSSSFASNADDPTNDRGVRAGVTPAADSEEEDPEESLRPAERNSQQPPPLSEDYRMAVIQRILEMCSRETYVNVTDFPWYVDVLVQLVCLAPVATTSSTSVYAFSEQTGDDLETMDVTSKIGLELLNVAVRVKDVRRKATQAAESLVLQHGYRSGTPSGIASNGFLTSALWITGEYASYLSHPSDVLTAMLHSSTALLPPDTLAVCVQAIPKVFIVVAHKHQGTSKLEGRAMTSLLIARVVHFLEGLSSHPSLEVQERSVEFAELMRLAAEAVSAQPASEDDSYGYESPLVIIQVIPSLFTGLELNPVAPLAQKKVPIPEGVDLESPLNRSLPLLLQSSRLSSGEDVECDESIDYYHKRPAAPTMAQAEPAANRLDQAEAGFPAYQQPSSTSDAETISRRKAERRERNKDDPFYIPTEADSGDSTPLHNILRNSNGVEVDIDSIPIMDLNIGSNEKGSLGGPSPRESERSGHSQRKQVEIAGDENITLFDEDLVDNTVSTGHARNLRQAAHAVRSKGKKSLLQVDSSGIGALSLDEANDSFINPVDALKHEEDEEMAKALKEVERLRLEMQRASERIQVAQGVPPEGTLIKKKVKKKKKPKASIENVASRKPKGESSRRDQDIERGQGEPGAAELQTKNSEEQYMLTDQTEASTMS